MGNGLSYSNTTTTAGQGVGKQHNNNTNTNNNNASSRQRTGGVSGNLIVGGAAAAGTGGKTQNTSSTTTTTTKTTNNNQNTTTTITTTTVPVTTSKRTDRHYSQVSMDDSAKSFGAGNVSTQQPQQQRRHQQQQHHHHQNAPSSNGSVLLTDSLKDVRVNYHIEPKELGHGHYGVVRKCQHRDTLQWYAIKSIRKSKVSKIEILKREIDILKEVEHPNIIHLIEVYEDERYLHLITELCTGGELFDRIIAKTQSSEGHFSEHDAAVLIRDILDAIRYCHEEKNIVHRDLKPENFLFLTPADDAPVKIIDFGLSRHDDTYLGIMQTKVGTPYYVAPEVLRREYTNSCDIWSIGVITYILLCGYPPFYGDSDTQIFESVRVGRFDFPSPEWDEISSNAKDFVTLLLQKDPMKRPSASSALQHKWLKDQLGFDEISGRVLLRSNRMGAFTTYLAVNKLKKAALSYIASNLTQAEVGTLKELFQSMDSNKDGYISLSELDEAIARGKFSDQILHDLRELRTNLAISGDQQIDWREFVGLTVDRSIVLREDNMRRAFEHFRHSNAEYLTIEDLNDIFAGKGPAVEIMNVLDTDHDGKVSFEDFRLAIMESMDDNERDEPPLPAPPSSSSSESVPGTVAATPTTTNINHEGEGKYMPPPPNVDDLDF